MFTYEASLERLDATWQTMLAARNLAGLRRRAYAATAFALCSVHTPVEQSEHEFAAYMSTGALPDGAMLAEQKARGLAEAQEWIGTTTVETFAVDGWTLADTILHNVYGLGTAKSAFASALCGNPEPYCIDTHGAELIADRVYYGDKAKVISDIRAPKGTESGIRRGWRKYREWGDTTFGSRNHQWEFFAFHVPAFRDAGHAVYFNEPFVGLAA